MRAKQNAVSRIPYPLSVGKKRMRKKHLYIQNYKKKKPLFLLDKGLIKFLLGCQKLCQKNFIKPFAPLTLLLKSKILKALDRHPLHNKNEVFVRRSISDHAFKIFDFKSILLKSSILKASF